MVALIFNGLPRINPASREGQVSHQAARACCAASPVALDYCVTCNHMHLLVEAAERREVSAWMQRVAGEFARACNQRKVRTNAFWGDNYHATLVEEGSYLWRCLCYIELNM